MNQRQLASVLFTALGVFVIIARLPDIFIVTGNLLTESVSVNAGATGPGSQSVLQFLGLGSFLLTVAIAGGLIYLRDRLAHRLFRAGGAPIVVPEAHAVALSVLGCYVAIQGLSRFSWSARFDWLAGSQIVLGIALFLGARGLSRLWSLVRPGSRSSQAKEQTA